ncbi:MAG: hypothetical protein IK061_07395, partial [Desulfovibrio sp.]|nr:hypothetical protein [Desulfovibrio sp.]
MPDLACLAGGIRGFSERPFSEQALQLEGVFVCSVLADFPGQSHIAAVEGHENAFAALPVGEEPAERLARDTHALGEAGPRSLYSASGFPIRRATQAGIIAGLHHGCLS